MNMQYKEDIKGWILARKMRQFHAVSTKIDNECTFVKVGEDKFPNDIIWQQQDDFCCYLEGFVVNKEYLIKKYDCGQWGEIGYSICMNPQILSEFRGGFCGFAISQNKILLFNDQLGNKAVYYYVHNGELIASTRWNYVWEVMKENQKGVTFDEQAARYMLTYGYMLDETTFANEIKRVLPGQYIYINIDTDITKKNRYFLVDNTHSHSVSLDHAVEILDDNFRQAVQREFSKDKEYGYNHLTDLSGGLDSRMTTWVAHVMGYTDQVNIIYCKKNYLDFKISQEIATDLKHEFIFKSVDDFKWYGDIEDIVRINNGAALYSGISGGKRLLSRINTAEFGIEHTGMIGDAIVSTFFRDARQNYARPEEGQLRYSNKLECSIPRNTLNQYKNMEQFALSTRGLLGAQTSYFIRQNYLETSSPFLDVDFVNAIFQIPFELRVGYKLYFEWLKQKYPEAARYGWERLGGIRPQRKDMWKKYFLYSYRYAVEKCRKIVNIPDPISMCPMDYYLYHDEQMQEKIVNYYREIINTSIIPPELQKDMKMLFNTGNAGEKSQVLTVLAMIKNFFYEDK